MSALFDADQELAAVAALLRDYGRFTALGITESHLTSGKCCAVFQAAQKLADSGTTVNFDTVGLELQRSGLAALVGGQEGLLELRRGAPGTILDPLRLRMLASLRAVRERLVEAAELAGQEDLAGAMSKLDEAVLFGKQESKLLDLHQLVDTALEESADRVRSQRKMLYPGSDSLEEAIGGFRAGGMYVLGALSNVGKSYLAQSWALRCVSREMVVGWVSLEDPEVTTGARALGMLSAVEPREIEFGGAFGDKASSDKISTGYGIARDWRKRFLFIDLTGQSEMDVCGAMSNMAARGAKIVFVDYVGVIGASKEQDDRRNEIRWISIRLKTHAKRLGVALVLISQLTMPRDEVGVAKEPSKYSLRECGDLTNAAEAIIVAWRENESDDADVHLKIAKSKIGGVGQHWLVNRDSKTHIFEDKTKPAVRLRQQPTVKRGFGLGS